MASKYLISLILLLLSCNGLAAHNNFDGKDLVPQSDCTRLLMGAVSSQSEFAQASFLDSRQSFLSKLDALKFQGQRVRDDKASLSELISNSDAMTMQFKKLLESADEEVSLIDESLEHEGQTYTYKVLDLGKILQMKSSGLSNLDRLARKAGVKTIRFDFLKSFLEGIAGSFHSASHTLTLSGTSARRLLNFDSIGYVIRHEIAHALFDRLKEQGIDSLYHFQFFTLGENAVLHDGNSYNRYMSAEELYNYINNPYWLSYDFLNLREMDSGEILRLVRQMRRVIDQIEDMALAHVLTAERFVPMLSEVAASEIYSYGQNWTYGSDDYADVVTFMDRSRGKDETYAMKFFNAKFRSIVINARGGESQRLRAQKSIFTKQAKKLEQLRELAYDYLEWVKPLQEEAFDLEDEVRSYIDDSDPVSNIPYDTFEELFREFRERLKEFSGPSRDQRILD